MVSLNSVEVLLFEDHVATIKPDPVAFSIARILLAAALIGAPLAFGAVESGAWMSLVLVACLALFLWTLGSVQQSAVKFVWSPLYFPLALFLILGLVQYGARLTVDKWETRAALVFSSASFFSSPFKSSSSSVSGFSR